MNPVIQNFQFGGQQVSIETSRIARQADGAVLVTMGGSTVLCTAVGAKSAKPGQDFFPLTINYQEKTYAAGKIPGGFFKREGRPSEKETLTSRLIDRPLRPLFPKGFRNEVQVICMVVSSHKDEDPDIAALIGASAALAISGVPFDGPVGAARVGYNNDDGYVINPTYSNLKDSALNMVVAGTSEAVLMVESEADELPEDIMLGAVLFAHQEMQTVIDNINSLVEKVGKPRWELAPAADHSELLAQIDSAAGQQISDAYGITDKQQRRNQLQTIKDTVIAQLCDDSEIDPMLVGDLFSSLEKKLVRNRIINKEPRIDGRDLTTVRPIHVEVGVLPGAHGSALFTRGETQALVVTTLGSQRDAQIIDALEGERRDPFMLHYNFPPYSVGECGRTGTPGRREIGHGRLARRGIAATLPNMDDFPYSIRIVSEITESNGSSSMASACGSSLSLMDAGVPVKAPVAGIAMGLVKEGDQFAVLTDILGDEDHLGDMDFKVAGSSDGITALQMDIKIQGINEEIMEIALQQALQARLHILGEMNKVISAPRTEVNPNAPRYETIKIDPDRIRDLIGKGGATIRSIVEDTGASIDVDDDGNVKIYAADSDVLNMAKDRVMEVTAEAEIGKIYHGKVARIMEFGAFVTILPGQDGLLHISQIAKERVNDVNDYLSEGQEINVKVVDVDQRGRIKLTMKDIEADATENAEAASEE